jgi:hypothetical protein
MQRCNILSEGLYFVDYFVCGKPNWPQHGV